MALQYWASAKLCGVEQRAPPIFGRADITLGIGPHFQFVFIFMAMSMVVFHLFVNKIELSVDGNAGRWAPSHNFVGLYLRN